MKELQIASAVDDFASISLEGATSTELVIQWAVISITFDTELAALRHLTEAKRIGERQPSEQSLRAFKMIMDFEGSEKRYQNLHEEFHQLADPSNRKFGVQPALLQKINALNEDHQAALQGLTRYANGLYFLQGCPGAGKTEFNMILTALIQSNHQNKANRANKKSSVLFLVDINKTVDDAANRYFELCKEVGLRKRIIRMHGFPYEMRYSQKLNTASGKSDEASGSTLNFTKRFLATAVLAAASGLGRSDNTAPTLDEAAWEYYGRHKEAECFATIAKSLDRLDTSDTLTAKDWTSLRGSIATLYKAVLAQADFVATTPVAASGSFNKLFNPGVIIIDEAPHARELTTLIPIAFFDPLLWLFSGDVRQTEPFVKGEDFRDEKDAARKGLKFNPYTAQLKISTMARAGAAGALNAQLLVNKRAHGNLHRLPSDLFYGGQMRSGHSNDEAMYPRSTMYLRRCLAQVGGIDFPLNENRIIVQLENSAEQMTSTMSFWNPMHQEWVLTIAGKLLSDINFQSLTKGRFGTIMIATPYKSATREYQAAVKKLNWPQEWRDRVEVLTVDKAQGNQADVVLLDMVRTLKAGFMNDPQRLNVAITRARQAEIIIMHEAMTTRPLRGIPVPTRAEHTSKLWSDTLFDGRVFLIPNKMKVAAPLSSISPNLQGQAQGGSLQKSSPCLDETLPVFGSRKVAILKNTRSCDGQ